MDKPTIKKHEVRKELTDEWQERGMKEGLEYALLTDEITRAWADRSVRDYKRFKGLRKENLRDNMTNLELVLNMLAWEVSTTEISKKKKPKGWKITSRLLEPEGFAARKARLEIEKQTGESVITGKNAKILKNKNLLSDDKRKNMTSKIFSAQVNGLRATIIEVEADVSKGIRSSQ